MSFLQISFILLTVLALAVGQILFKLAATAMSLDRGILANLFDYRLLIALLVYAVATLMWLAVLRTTSLRLAYPFVALAFVIVPVLAHFILREPLGWNTFAGATLIALGVWVSVWQ